MTDPPPELNLERFEQGLDRHGADLARWPERERAAAVALIAADPRARRALELAQALELGLAGMPVPEPSAALRRAVAEIPLRHPRPAAAESAFAWLPLRSAFALFASALLITALGAASGAWASDLDLSLSAEPQVESESSGEADALTELSELAFAAELDEELAP